MSTSADPPAGAGMAVEYRAAQRYRILQRCHVRPPGVTGRDGWRSIAYSISATGIGVTLPLPVVPGTEIDVEPWQLPGAGPLRATVVHASRLEFVWLCGCRLAAPLAEPELTAWLATATI